MHRQQTAPAVFIAFAAVPAFYGLHGLVRLGYPISSFVFLIALAALTASVIAGLIMKKNNRIPPPVFLLLCYLVLGIAAGSYGERALQKKNQPPYTLAPAQSICALAVELESEPLPAGEKYYRIPAKLLYSIDKTHALFSAGGHIQLLLPSGLVNETYSGGVSQIGKKVEPDPYTELLADMETSFKTALQQGQICRSYTRGIILFIQGRFNKTGRVFYVEPRHPLFLGWHSFLSRLRAFFRFHFSKLLYGWGEAGGLLLALLAADKTFLPETCVTAFRNAGLAHILALSGMHISLISTAALQGGRLFGHKKRAVRFSLIAVGLFVWFAGAAPSLNRALGMLLIAAAGKALGLRPAPLPVLSTMFIFHITVWSTDALQLGFMLSYGACAGIIIFGQACAGLLAGKIPPDIAGSISASVGAQLFTAPIVISAIGTLAPVGIIASCIVGVLISFFLIAGLICIPLAVLFPATAQLIGTVLQCLYHLIFSLADFFARFPLITVQTYFHQLLFSCIALFSGLILVAAAHFYNRQTIRSLRKI